MNAYVRSTRCLVVWKWLPLFLVLLLPTTSRAELIDYFGTALSGWSGSVHLNDSGRPDVLVDYAVYARADFNAAFGDIASTNHDPYVYTYQLRNGATSPVIKKFTVGFIPGNVMSSDQIITEISDPELPGGVATSLTPAFAPSSAPYTSAAWTFNNTIGAGAKSEILLFTSPVLPLWQPCTVQGAILGESGNVPSPVPEPVGLITLLIASALFILVWPRRRSSFR
jgi:hypothetical protein